jgi:hypothetical protein
MNRRDALKAIAAVAPVASAVEATEATTRDTALVALKFDRRLSHEEMARVHDIWKQAVEGTPLEGRKVLILDQGATMCEVTARGEIRAFPGFA